MNGCCVILELAFAFLLLTYKAEILHRWAELLDSAINRPSHIQEVKTNMSIDDPPTAVEVEKAIAAFFNGKVPGSDAILAEIY